MNRVTEPKKAPEANLIACHEEMAAMQQPGRHGRPTGTTLMPWASEKVRNEIGPGSFERKLNELAEHGWIVVSCTTASAGNFLYHVPAATAVLQRERNENSTGQPT